MSRLAAAAAALVLAGAGGTARADSFEVVPVARTPVVLPSAETPNAPGSLRLPAGWTRAASRARPVAYSELEALWHRAGSAYGVPWEVLAAINKIESNFGENMGPSSAGAVGWMQFMPETWLRWGMDGDGDGLADPWTAEDGVYAAARYLAAAGARTDLRRAIFAYNHANWYVEDVLELAAHYASDAPDAGFTLAGSGAEVGAAEAGVVRLRAALTAALRTERALARVEARLFARADAPRLLSDRLAAHKQAVLAQSRRAQVTQRVVRLRAELAGAEAALAEARVASEVSGLPTGSERLAAPTAQDGYVFPVGGGPSVVSVARAHHDYPAADIAAPSGAPLYALAEGVVVRAWRYDARCGIGFTIRTADGLVWTYCHLSFLSPSVEAGAVLPAGAAVGLVGSTGYSTGPHLHLQLQPATSYPQEQPWFQAFAGRAFRWQGEAAPPPPPARGDVFAPTPASGADVVAFTR